MEQNGIVPYVTFEALAYEYAQRIMESEGEVTPELDEATLSLSEKGDACGYVMDALEARIALVERHMKEMQQTRKTLETGLEYLKSKVKSGLNTAGIKKLTGDRWTISLVACQKSLKINVPIENIPMEYVDEKISYEANKSKLKEALLSGKEIPGVTLEGGYSLRKSINSDMKKSKEIEG